MSRKGAKYLKRHVLSAVSENRAKKNCQNLPSEQETNSLDNITANFAFCAKMVHDDEDDN